MFSCNIFLLKTFHLIIVKPTKLFCYLCRQINKMKALAWILSIYILILTAIPCVDVPQDNAMLKVELSQNAPHHQHNDVDQCSPFCVCSCCVSPIAHQVCSINFTCYSFSSIQLCKYLSADLSSTNTSIWQPPKIS